MAAIPTPAPIITYGGSSALPIESVSTSFGWFVSPDPVTVSVTECRPGVTTHEAVTSWSWAGSSVTVSVLRAFPSTATVSVPVPARLPRLDTTARMLTVSPGSGCAGTNSTKVAAKSGCGVDTTNNAVL